MQATTFIIDDKGKRLSAIVPIKKYEQLISEAEDIDDIRAYDAVMNRKHKFMPLEEALKEVEKMRKKK